jgi:spermidine/putrescine transport system substrate-binding protein
MNRAIRLIAAGLLMGMGALHAAPEAEAAGELKIYNWFDYMPQELLDKFSKKYDVKVTMDTYDSNETLLARLKSGVEGYDVAVPGDYMVAILISEGMLEKVEPNKMENFKNVTARLRNVYWDPNRDYSVPYQWGTTSFMVDTAAYSGDIDTLKIFIDPPEELKGQINMLKDMNEVINMGLRYLNFPRCNDNPEQLKQVNDLLTRAKAHWKSINSDGAKEVLVSGDVKAGMIWNGFGLRARQERPTLKFSFPREGLTAFADNLVVLKGAPNLENAKLFLNFMMEPENAGALTNFARYSAGVDGVEPFLDEIQKTAREVNPPPGSPEPEFVPPCSPNVVELYDRIWTNLLK